MALLHQATLQPTKLELLTSYLDIGPLTQLGAYRFDDPAGDVGIETHLVADPSGVVLHLPLTYRSEPLAGADEWGVGTTEHSVLGTRWVYNGCADPVYVAQLIEVILTGGSQVEQYFETAEGRRYRDPSATAVGSGQAGTPVPAIAGVQPEAFEGDTVIDAGGIHVVVRHRLDSPEPDTPSATLTGTWTGADASHVLAYIP